MFNLALHLIGLHGGIILYLISLLLFKTFKPRIVNLVFLGISLLPGIGTIFAIGLLIWQVFGHEIHPQYANVEDRGFCDIIVRRHALNRWLFNDIDWEIWDHTLAKQKENAEKAKQQ